MDSRRFLDLSRELVSGVKRATPITAGAGEPECRSAIGRAYYAAFLTARAFLKSIGIVVAGTSSSHSLVQFALNKAGVDLLTRIASQLRELYGDRIRADYELSDSDPERLAVAENAVGRAEFVLTAFELISTGRVNPPIELPAAASAVLAWAKANGQESKIHKS
jgi:uncharacterized protein (UPF0332 family)